MSTKFMYISNGVKVNAKEKYLTQACEALPKYFEAPQKRQEKASISFTFIATLEMNRVKVRTHRKNIYF